ncbi:MAG: hypothetical protein HY975_04620 [Candidatus Kerfeldbacteria bacterium]|nr:hypothetical protein [Candidatus Kerfeldbacteria bacterium]
MRMPTQRLSIWAAVVVFLLLIPLVAMQFTTQVDWNLSDFVFMGILLFGAALTYELVARRMNDYAYRTAVALAVLSSLMLVWINAAVGIIGNEDNPANLMYFAVLAVGFLGAIFSRFRALGMSRVMFAMAVIQMPIPVIALIIGPRQGAEPPGVIGVFMLNAFFAMLFVGSGLLFRQAGTQPSAAAQTV